MDAFQAVYLVVCIVFAKLDYTEGFAKPPHLPRMTQEAILVGVIISWPVWLVPAVCVAIWRKK